MARHTLELAGWTARLEEKTGYSVDQLQDLLLQLHNVFIKAEGNQQQAVREKFKQQKCVILFTPSFNIKHYTS